jgi:hypothetical protein
MTAAQIIETFDISDRHVVVMYVLDPLDQSESEHVLGYHEVELRNGRWYVINGGGIRVDESQEIVDYGSGTGNQGGRSDVVIFGEVLSPTIALVEADFNNGETRQGDVHSNVFFLLNQNASGVCSLRLLNEAGELLREDSLIPSPDVTPTPDRMALATPTPIDYRGCPN